MDDSPGARRACPRETRQARWLARLTVVAVAPELAGQDTTLAELAESVVAEARAGAPLALDAGTHGDGRLVRRAVPKPRISRLARASARPAASAAAPADAAGSAAAIRAARVSTLTTSRSRNGRRAASIGTRARRRAAEPLAEHASRGAGVLLVIRALDRLGLGARLERDADAAASGFGRHLLRHIAARARVAPDDALFTLLTAPDPPPYPDALRAWRVGLDRWLRRRARLRLSELARVRGWLHLTDSTLLVRFPLDAADIRLRRLALDSDPGWVPWLGLAVQYHYRDAPLG